MTPRMLGVDLDPQKHDVILDVVPGRVEQDVVGYEHGEAETEGVGVGLGRRAFEVFPGWVGPEALDDVDGLLWLWVLVVKRERHVVTEGPLQKGVVFAWEDLDVAGMGIEI